MLFRLILEFDGIYSPVLLSYQYSSLYLGLSHSLLSFSFFFFFLLFSFLLCHFFFQSFLYCLFSFISVGEHKVQMGNGSIPAG